MLFWTLVVSEAIHILKITVWQSYVKETKEHKSVCKNVVNIQNSEFK